MPSALVSDDNLHTVFAAIRMPGRTHSHFPVRKILEEPCPGIQEASSDYL